MDVWLPWKQNNIYLIQNLIKFNRKKMTHLDWDKLRIFHVVSIAGSFTQAGEILGLSQSAVSRQIRSLEESLSSSLFQRHPRGLILTEQGEILLSACF